MSTRPTTTQLPPFERVVAVHGPGVLRFCALQVGRERAEDCFQETMISALRAYDKVRDPAAIRAWLFAIAARKAIDSHRARARDPEPVAEVGESPAPSPGAGDEDGLWARVRALPPKQRQAVTLRFMADLTHAEVADVLGITEAAARRNAFEGVDRLRKESATS